MPSTQNKCIRNIEFEGKLFSLAFHSDNDHIGRQVAQSGGFYEAELLSALRPLLRPGDVVVDVGANVGNHSIFFAGVLDCKVFAFEGLERTCDLLRTNIRLNGLTDRVFARQYALGAVSGTVEVESIDESNLGATRFKPGPLGPINLRPLDSMPELAGVSVSLLKVDVEGMELDVIRGSRNVIERDRPIIVCECAEPEEFAGVEFLLGQLGYSATECFNATPTYVFLPDQWSGRGTFTRTSYFERIQARTSMQMRLSLSQLNRIRNMVGILSQRIEALELVVSDTIQEDSEGSKD
ncbi:FkbM family methyltransferase [Arthrobacter oryzae]|nr:FkbM family methyltransferase [Arthrobacter oryzae]